MYTICAYLKEISEFDSFIIVYAWFTRSWDEREKKNTKGRKEMVVTATNKELQFDWIMHSPNDRHSTGAFYSLIDGIDQTLKEYFDNFLIDIIYT